MIVNKNGESFYKQESGYIVIFVSEDDGETWTPLYPQSVPKWIKEDPDVLGEMMAGNIACNPNNDLSKWYRAESIERQLH